MKIFLDRQKFLAFILVVVEHWAGVINYIIIYNLTFQT